MRLFHSRFLVLLLGFLLLICLFQLFIRRVAEVHAQSITDWDPPTVLFDAGETANVFTPLIIEDTRGEIKILWETTSALIEGTSTNPDGIYCVSRDGNTWSYATDVITLSKSGRLFWLRHAMDSYGQLHLVFVGPDSQLHHSWVPSAEACNARDWETRTVPTPNNVLYGNIEIDNQGIIHIVYAARGEDVYYLQSMDNGYSWSEPVIVSSVTPDRATSFPDVAADKKGRIYVVWEEDLLPDGVPGLGLFLAKSEDNGNTWSSPALFSQSADEYTQPTVFTMSDETVHIMWNGRISQRGRYIQSSADHAASWSQAIEFIPKTMGGGQTGPPAYDFDSLGRVHVSTGTSNTTYAAWTGQEWSNPLVIASYDIFGNMEHQNILVSHAQEVFVVANAGQQRIILVQGRIDAPALTPIFEKLLIATQEPKQVASRSSVSPTSAPDLPAIDYNNTGSLGSTFYPVAVGTAMALSVGFLAVLVKWRRHRS